MIVGVCFYRIDAAGKDPANGTGGTNYSSVRKMTLLK